MWLYIGVLQGQVFTWMWLYVRVSIHLKKDYMTRQCILQWWAVEQHIQNCEHQYSNGGQLIPKIFLKLLRDPLHHWKQCIAKGCISMYWRECGWYDWTWFNNVKLLSSICKTVNISVAVVDSSPPRFFLNFWGILCILENSALQKVAYLCIDVSMDDMTG